MDPVLLFLAGITAFIIFRLISVMGTREGHEQNHDMEALQRHQTEREPMVSPVPEERPQPVKVQSARAKVLSEADPTFDEEDFLHGAKMAYEMIVEAFSKGDLNSIRPFISEPIFTAFTEAVKNREALGHQSDLKFVGIEKSAMTDSELKDNTMSASVSFSSNQVRVTRDRDGNVVDGDPNRIDLVKDHWTFSRERDARDPNWILVATGGEAV